MDLATYQEKARQTSQLPLKEERHALPALLGLASEIGSILDVYKRYLRDNTDLRSSSMFFKEELGDVLWYTAAVATACDLKLEDIAADNLKKTHNLYPTADASSLLATVPVLDAAFLPEERFPRKLIVRFSQEQTDPPVATMYLLDAKPNAFPDGPKTVGGKVAGFQIGRRLGSPLTDNSRVPDDYRFHDAIHFGFLAALGWSPTLRALLQLKRRSSEMTDQVEDGARAIFSEEGLSAVLAHLAAERHGFASETNVDSSTLMVVRAATAGLEVEALPLWLWRRAICLGFGAMRQLVEHGGGRLVVDLNARSLTFEREDAPAHTIAQRSDRVRAAMIAMHRVKSADYGPAWKKRGEVISILANIARKVDRLEFVGERQTATADESLADTIVDLVVYALKYRTFLADIDADVAAALGPKRGPGLYSDGVEGLEMVLSSFDLTPLELAPTHSMADAFQQVSRAFGELERCFKGADTTSSPRQRDAFAAALAKAGVNALAALATARPATLETVLSHWE